MSQEIEAAVKQVIAPLCDISLRNNTKYFIYHISVYDGCTKEMIDDVIFKTIYGVNGLRDELKALKEDNEK